MIEIKKEDLLKNTIDYEDYSENICELSVEELKKEGLLKCGGCCSKGGASGGCSGCCSKKENNNCDKCKNKNSGKR